ncbi:hypothetical protein CAF53_02400 [Sphingobium sp. LB126]|nr:hypothetical protein CAF53_02400 [Sphingobium sp. LB126]
MLLALLLFGCARPAAAQPASPVYFLSVGSSRFLQPADPADHGFPELLGARNGANSLADLLAQGGAKFGITLTSPEGSIVGKKDIDAAVEAILARIAKDRRAGETPLLIVYIAAHGISDGFSWNQFSVPGDLTYRGEPEKLSPVELAEQAIHAATLVDRLNKAKLHYLLVVDTCYEGTPSRLDSPVLTPMAQQNIGDIATALRFLNEFHQNDPVLFSIEPGKTVKVAPDPADPTHNSMGPLARRLVLLINSAKANGRGVTLASMVAALTDPHGDPLTTPSITHAQRAAWWDMPVIRAGAQPGEIEDREGTATVPQLCCLAKSARAAAAPKPLPARGSVILRSAAGESILGGQPLTLTKDFAVTFSDPQTLDIAVADPDGDWSFEFAAPIPLAIGRYAGATRSPFQQDGRNGMSASGHSSGCNELHGEFEITALPGAGGGRLALRFTQYCDDDKAPLTGTIDLAFGN